MSSHTLRIFEETQCIDLCRSYPNMLTPLISALHVITYLYSLHLEPLQTYAHHSLKIAVIQILITMEIYVYWSITKISSHHSFYKLHLEKPPIPVALCSVSDFLSPISFAPREDASISSTSKHFTIFLRTSLLLVY